MKQTSKRLMSVLISLGFIVIALVVLFDLIEPEYGNVVTLKGQIAGENEFLGTEKTAIAQAQKLIAQYQAQSQGASSVAFALPSGPDLAGGLAQIYGLAQNTGVTLQTVQIGSPQLVAQAGIGTASTTDTLKPLGQYQFQLSVVGSYEAMKNFLLGLETNIRIFDVQSISVAPAQIATNSGKGVAPLQDLFNYQITVATYYQEP